MIERDRIGDLEAEIRRAAADLGPELEVHYLESTASTNTWALDRVQAAEHPAPAVIVADRQLAGRGQHGRSWFAARGSLALTYLPRLEHRGLEAPSYSMAAAVAAREVLASWLPRPPRLKWPNDLLASTRKLAGILVESRSIGTRRVGPVIGIGVNVDLEREAFPAELRDAATSLRIESGRCPPRNELAGRLARAFDAWLESARFDGGRALCERYLDGLELRGRAVQLSTAEGSVSGSLVHLDEEDGVRLRCTDREISVPLAQITALREAVLS